MPVIFLLKLQQTGAIHPGCWSGDNLIELLESNLNEDTVNIILNLYELKIQIMSEIEALPGWISSICIISDDHDYIYHGSIWETGESFMSMLSHMQESKNELVLSFNKSKKAFYEWAEIEFTNGKLYLLDTDETITFESIDVLYGKESIDITTPFDLIR